MTPNDLTFKNEKKACFWFLLLQTCELYFFTVKSPQAAALLFLLTCSVVQLGEVTGEFKTLKRQLMRRLTLSECSFNVQDKRSGEVKKHVELLCSGISAAGTVFALLYSSIHSLQKLLRKNITLKKSEILKSFPCQWQLFTERSCVQK